MKIKHIILLSTIIIYCIVFDTQYLNVKHIEGQLFLEDIGLECGTVTENFTDLVNVKHGTTTDYFLKVKFPDGERIVNVSPETFYKNYKINTSVCFNKSKSIPLTQLISLFITMIFLLILIALFAEFFSPLLF